MFLPLYKFGWIISLKFLLDNMKIKFCENKFYAFENIDE